MNTESRIILDVPTAQQRNSTTGRSVPTGKLTSLTMHEGCDLVESRKNSVRPLIKRRELWSTITRMMCRPVVPRYRQRAMCETIFSMTRGCANLEDEFRQLVLMCVVHNIK